MAPGKWLAGMVAACAAWGLASSALAAEGAPPSSARLERYTKPDGRSYFALSLTAPAGEAAGPVDVVALVDTSASQVGPFREKSLQALQALLTSLRAEDRVQVLAVDADVVPLTQGFVAPGSDEAKAAVAALEARVPLGSTDMPAALRAAAATFAENHPTRAIAYIGDGMSAANVLQSAGFAQLAADLVGVQAPVSCYAVGPRIDTLLLAALGNHTGGRLLIDHDALADGEAGRFLADSSHAQVYYPQSAVWPHGLTEVFPAVTPPLRSDRDTVVIGAGELSEAGEVAIKADAAGQTTELTWNVAPAPSDDKNAFLATLVEQAQPDHGATLATLGTAGLTELRGMFAAGGQGLVELGRQAVAAGNLTNAETLAKEALQRDPHDPAARALQGAVQLAQAGHGQDELLLAQAPDAATADAQFPAEEQAFDEQGRLLNAFETQRRLLAQSLQADVQDALNQARGLMGDQPELAQTDLKLVRERVLRAEIEPELRAQLLAQIDTSLRNASRLVIEHEQRAAELAQERAAAAEENRIAENLTRDEQRVDQLMQRFNALMAEGRYVDAEVDAAMPARDLMPRNPVPVAAMLTARTAGYYVEAMALREARQRGFVDTLAQAERASIAFPDDPPIVYPDPQFWAELTAARAKYKRADLSEGSPAEQKIYA